MKDKNVIDLIKLRKIGFKKKVKNKVYKSLHGFMAEFSWYDDNGEYVHVIVDPNNPFLTLTTDGKIIAIEHMNQIIASICMDDAAIAAEYTRMLEKVYKQLKTLDHD